MNILQILPFTKPIDVFVILVATILISPFLFRIIKVPDVAAFIISGVIIGPYGFSLIKRDASIELLGTIGLLYIMFIAGLELNLKELKKHKKNSIIFGLFTFAIPFILGITACTYLFEMPLLPSLLVSIMFSTHTLVAYPIIRKLGVNNDVAVLTAVGGTIITDTLVLVALSFITRVSENNSLAVEIIQLIAQLGLYLTFVFFTYPKISRWFFKHIKRDRPVHFLYVLFMLSISSVLSDLIGFEPIIGAFVAGLALNQSIPKNSLLTHHIDFVGNILFIPLFLIGIGMQINLRIMISGINLWYISVVFIFIAISGKWLAALVSGKIIRLSATQINLLFGLTSSHAAATMAIILIGLNKHIIDETFFNATVLIILSSSLFASIVSEKFGKKILLRGNDEKKEEVLKRIMVPVSNPFTMHNLVSIANSLQDPGSVEQVYVLSIVNDDNKFKENLLEIRKNLEENLSDYNNLRENMKVITRVDLNISNGILRSAKEYHISDIVFGWSKKKSTSERLFGNIFDHLVESTQTLYACNLTRNIIAFRNIIFHLPPTIELESTFPEIMHKLAQLPFSSEAIIELRSESSVQINKYKLLFTKRSRKKPVLSKYEKFTYYDSANKPNCLDVYFLLRKQSVSYKTIHNVFVRNRISSNPENDFILVVPGLG